MQGDIVAITDASGTKVVEYLYDSWGKLISTTGSLASTVGAKNPYRYRGYRYDVETGLYYLQSRYYDPVVKRFINADSYASTGQGILGNNMFSYCQNTPVSFSDENGQFLCAAIGAVVGAVCGAISASIDGKCSKDIFAIAVNGAVSGFISGAAADIIMVTGGTGAVVIAAYASAGAIGGYVGSLTESAICGKDIFSREAQTNALIAAIFGAFTGTIFGAMSGSVKPMMQEVTENAGRKTLEKGVTYSYAIVKTIKRELRGLGSSLVEESISGFISKYIERNVQHYIS